MTNQDFLLVIGVVIIAGFLGIEIGCRFMESHMSDPIVDRAFLPDPLNQLATGLANLHVVHTGAKQQVDAAKTAVEKALNDHIEELKKQFSL